MKLIDADQMAIDESAAYISAQVQVGDELTRKLNEVVHMKIQQLIADTPTVDAVPVVRCRDCKYRTKDTRLTRAGFCGRRGAGDFFVAPPDGYCHYGSRK